jgi:hypothetical protein
MLRRSKLQEENQDMKKENVSPSSQTELSATWLELLGKQHPSDQGAQPEGAVPPLASDPWNSLSQAQGIKIVDLQRDHLQISDQEVEQMLQLIQEEPATRDDEGSSSTHQ